MIIMKIHGDFPEADGGPRVFGLEGKGHFLLGLNAQDKPIGGDGPQLDVSKEGIGDFFEVDDQLDKIAVPQGLKNGIGKVADQDVLDGFLCHVMVDAKEGNYHRRLPSFSPSPKRRARTNNAIIPTSRRTGCHQVLAGAATTTSAVGPAGGK